MIPPAALSIIPWRLIGVATLVGALCLWSRSCGVDDGKAEGRAEVAKLERAKAQQEVDLAVEGQRIANEQAETYRKRAEAANAAAAQYLKDVGDANDRANDLVGAVAAGDVRFRKLWASCHAVPAPGSAAADPGEAQDSAELQAASLGRIDRAVSECQAQATAILRLAECDRDPTRAECRE